ncbi:uncharacterized protein [Haliotis cracherodii]|uniref:uncharacterized protein n=1 Tax=Haliotis cracherodii TaxID=6455 RepID=UPI0039EC5987
MLHKTGENRECCTRSREPYGRTRTQVPKPFEPSVKLRQLYFCFVSCKIPTSEMKLYIQALLVFLLVAVLTVGRGEGCVVGCMRGLFVCKRQLQNGQLEDKDPAYCCDNYKKCYSECKPGKKYIPCNIGKRGSWNKRYDDSRFNPMFNPEDPYFL